MIAGKTEIFVLITIATILIIVNTFFIAMTTILITTTTILITVITILIASSPHHIDHLLLSKAKKAVGGLC